MRKIKCVFLFVNSLFLSCSVNSLSVKSEFQIIQLEEFYSGQGAIIPATSIEYFGNDSTKFTPSIEQIKQAELILKNDLHNHYWKDYYFGGFFYNESKDSTELYEEFEDQVNKYKTDLTYFNRYYLGYRNLINEVIIKIAVFDATSCESKEMFKNWQNKYYWYLGSYSEYMRNYEINLNDNDIEHF